MVNNGPLPFWKERAFRCILSRSFAAFMLLGVAYLGVAGLKRYDDLWPWLSFMALFSLYTGLLGALIALPAGALWFALRPLRGEPLVTCMLFGLLPGLVFGLMFNNPFRDAPAVLTGCALGAAGGLIFWILGKLPALIGARHDA